MNVTDRQTDGHRPIAKTTLMHIVSHGKNSVCGQSVLNEGCESSP